MPILEPSKDYFVIKDDILDEQFQAELELEKLEKQIKIQNIIIIVLIFVWTLVTII